MQMDKLKKIMNIQAVVGACVFIASGIIVIREKMSNDINILLQSKNSINVADPNTSTIILSKIENIKQKIEKMEPISLNEIDDLEKAILTIPDDKLAKKLLNDIDAIKMQLKTYLLNTNIK